MIARMSDRKKKILIPRALVNRSKGRERLRRDAQRKNRGLGTGHKKSSFVLDDDLRDF